MDSVDLPVRDDIAGQADYWMANLREKTTGLPFIVFISQRDGCRHDLRVKVSPAPRVQAHEMASYSVRPFAHQGGPAMTAQYERLLERWIGLNKDVLEQYWDGDIEYTEDAIARIVPIDG